MTVSDLIERLKRIMKEKGSAVQVHLGKVYNDTQEKFEFFEIDAKGKDIVLVPTDKWDRNNFK